VRRYRRGIAWKIVAIVLVLVAEVSLVLIGTCVDPETRYAWKEWVTSGLRAATGSEKTSPGGQMSGRYGLDVEVTYLGNGEADFGEYTIEVFDPMTETILRTDFRLKACTTCVSEDEFDRFMQRNRQFFREQVMIAVRTCRFDELATPDLELLGKKLTSRVNRAIGRPFLKSASIADYQPMASVDNSPFYSVVPEDAGDPQNSGDAVTEVEAPL